MEYQINKNQFYKYRKKCTSKKGKLKDHDQDQ